MSRTSLRRTIRRALRRAFTLVELLIAMGLTLILVFAIAEFYAYVGASVKDGRAMIDLVAQLRTATAQLKADLGRLTLVPRPPADDANSPGYLEYLEGLGNDWDSNANWNATTNNRPDATEDLDTDGVFDFLQNNYSSMLGDIDDVLAFTIRSDSDPLIGYGYFIDATPGNDTGIPDFTRPAPFSSSKAEVVWFSSFVDQDGDGIWDPSGPGVAWATEPRVLHRRQLIVDDGLNRLHPGDSNVSFPYFFRIQEPFPNSSIPSILLGMQMFDVAIQDAGVFVGYRYFVAKSFYSLTRRENRFAHLSGYSSRIDLNAHLMQRDTTLPLTASVNYGSMGRWVQQGLRKGDDVMLSNVLSFDVRVFDPTAPIRADGDSTGATGQTTDDAIGVVQPGDPGWDAAVQANVSNPGICPIIGAGCFVDLAYNRYLSTAPISSTFSTFPAFPGFPTRLGAYIHGNVPPGPAVPPPPPHLPGLGATFDTWATSYERDGIAQLLPPDAPAGRMDLASNGLDDTEIINGNYVGGIDDVSERETSPPYPVPLRGIQAKVRVYEPSTRQVRQATIGWDFIAD